MGSPQARYSGDWSSARLSSSAAPPESSSRSSATFSSAAAGGLLRRSSRTQPNAQVKRKEEESEGVRVPECSGLNTQRGGGATYGAVEDITRSELDLTLHESCDPQQGSGGWRVGGMNLGTLDLDLVQQSTTKGALAYRAGLPRWGA